MRNMAEVEVRCFVVLWKLRFYKAKKFRKDRTELDRKNLIGVHTRLQKANPIRELRMLDSSFGLIDIIKIWNKEKSLVQITKEGGNYGELYNWRYDL